MGFLVLLPRLNTGFKLSGVYRILFDDGFFYIGCSVDLRSRSSGWGGIVKNPDAERGLYALGALMVAKIKERRSCRFEIVELCDASDVKDREGYYLNKFKDDPFLLSVPECQYKPVLQYKKDGCFVKRHDSITAAAKYNNTSLWRIQEVLNGNRGSHAGMVFIHENEYNKRRQDIVKRRYQLELPKKNKNVKVVQCNTEGEALAVHKTYAAAGRIVGCDPQNIKRVVAGRQKTAGGFKWKLQIYE